MPISGIEQPDVLPIDGGLRLRRYDGAHGFALAWYQDEDLVWLVYGDRKPYDEELLGRMYTYLDQHGELYWIEVMERGFWLPIGDVTFWQEDMPIVIGEARYRGCGIGGRVIVALIRRGRELGYDHLCVEEIYDWNEASRRCFERAGFRVCGKTQKGSTYRLILTEEQRMDSPTGI